MKNAPAAALLLAFVRPLAAQIDIGVVGGVPFTHFILDRSASSRLGSTAVKSAPRRYTVGPFAEWHVRGPFGVEAGVLYKRFGFDTRYSSVAISQQSATTGNSWEFPLLAKAHVLFARHVAGHFAAGPVVRRITGAAESGVRTTRAIGPPPRTETAQYVDSAPAGMNRRTSLGLAAGAGLDFHSGPLRLSPGFRLVRWDTERTSSLPAGSRLARTQAEGLLHIGLAAGRRQAAPARIPRRLEAGLSAGLPFLSAGQGPFWPPSPSTTFDSRFQRYLAGFLADWRFHARLSLEASFLARPFGFTQTQVSGDSIYRQTLSGWGWEIPVQLKWRAARTGRTALFVGCGPAIGRPMRTSETYQTATTTFKSDAAYLRRTALGGAVSAGFEMKAGRARLRPEVRFSRYSSPLFATRSTGARNSSLHLILGASWIGEGGR